MYLKPILLTLSLCFMALNASAISKVTIQPGGEISIDAGDEMIVRCDGNSIDETVICDCNYNNTYYGEAVAITGHSLVCKTIHSFSQPFNCRKIQAPVICDCNYNGNKQGEAVGINGLAKACKDLHSYSSPQNCKHF